MSSPISVLRFNSRRQFVKLFVLGTVTSVAGPKWMRTLLGEFEAVAAPGDGIIVLNLSDYPPLQSNNSGIRISVNPFDVGNDDIYPGTFYPVLVNRGSGNTFYALSTECTHQGCVVNAFDGLSSYCNCHGSEFGVSGQVTSGPANQPLDSYALTFDNVNTLRITIPGLGYSITNSAVEPVAPARLRLSFPTFYLVEYEVRFRQTVSNSWSVVSFATTAGGLANNTFLTGDGTAKTVWVDRAASTGFYAVAIRIKEV